MNPFRESIREQFHSLHPFEDPKWVASLGLKIPPIRSLPRSLEHEELGISTVAEPFQSVSTLKKMLIDDEILSLYKKTYSAPRVVLLTYVCWDGLGDYCGQKNIFDYLQAEGIEVVRATFVHKEHSYEEGPEFLLPFMPGEEVEIPNALMEKMRKAHLILQFPNYYPFTAELQKKVGKGPLWECLGESGFMNTLDFQPGTGRRCLGLHALEKGVFIPTLPSTIPPPSIEKPYYFAYTRTEKGFFNYLEALLALKKEKIRVVTFNMPQVIATLKKGMDGLRNVLIENNEIYVKQKMGTDGCDVTITVYPEVKQEVFVSLLAHAEPFVACTGDHSFFEALSLDKVIYYDALPHKKAFFEDLRFIAGYATPKASLFFEDAKWIRDREVQEGLQTFYTYIKTHFRANEKIIHLINRSTMPHEVLKEEELLLHAFGEGKLQAAEVLASLKRAISQQGLRGEPSD
ncbi:MAG: hypothetical protein KDK76_00205 [Chlamydiia bacterium]|nr:hypothetical protein [Chlamydiia bacterium]